MCPNIVHSLCLCGDLLNEEMSVKIEQSYSDCGEDERHPAPDFSDISLYDSACRIMSNVKIRHRLFYPHNSPKNRVYRPLGLSLKISPKTLFYPKKNRKLSIKV